MTENDTLDLSRRFKQQQEQDAGAKGGSTNVWDGCKRVVLAQNEISNLVPIITRISWFIPSTVTSLDLSNNHLGDLTLPQSPQEIRGETNPCTVLFKVLAPSLASLNLSNNGLIELPSSIGLLTHLRELDLENNLLEGLPSELGNLDYLASVRIDGNPLRSLPHKPDLLPGLIPSPNSRPPFKTYDLLEFCKQLNTQNTQWDALKIVCLGDASSGRSSLLNLLSKQQHKKPTTTTTSFQALKVDVGGIRMTLLDFPTEEMLQTPLSKLFFSRNSTFLIVVKMNKRIDEMAESVNHWLDSIISHPDVTKATAAAKAPPFVIVVATYSDEVENPRDLMIRLIPALKIPPRRTICVDISSGTGISEFTDMNLWRDMLPIQYVHGCVLSLSRFIRNRSCEYKILTLKEFINWSRICGFPSSKKMILDTIDLLNDSGDIVHYGGINEEEEKEKEEEDFVFLSSAMLSDIVLGIQWSSINGIARSLMEDNELLAIWRRYGFRSIHLNLIMHIAGRIGVIERAQTSSSWVMIPWLENQSQSQSSDSRNTSIWPNESEIGYSIEHSREYKLEFSSSTNSSSSSPSLSTPMKMIKGLYDKICLACAAIPGTTLITHSQNHLLLKLPRNAMVLLLPPQKQQQQQQQQQNGGGYKLSFRYRSDRDTPKDVIANTIRAIGTCFGRSIMHSNFKLIGRSIYCTHCLSSTANLNPEKEKVITEFSFAQVLEALSTHSSLRCNENGGENLDPNLVAPDLAMLDVPKKDTETVDSYTKVSFLPTISFLPSSEQENESAQALMQQSLHFINECSGYSSINKFVGVTPPFDLLFESPPLGTLRNFLDSSKEQTLSWQLRLLIALDISAALYRLHSCTPSVIHGRISPLHIGMFSTNIINQNVPRAKICATCCPPHDPYSGSLLPRWAIAPEIFSPHNQQNQKQPTVDIYGLGLVMWELCSLINPETILSKHGTTALLTAQRIQPFQKQEFYSAAISASGILSSAVEKDWAIGRLVRRCIDSCPADRPQLSEIIEGICSALRTMGISTANAKNVLHKASIRKNLTTSNADFYLGASRSLIAATRTDEDEGGNSGKLVPHDVVCITTTEDGRIFTGTSNGRVLVWHGSESILLRSWDATGRSIIASSSSSSTKERQQKQQSTTESKSLLVEVKKTHRRVKVSAIACYKGCVWVATDDLPGGGVIRVWTADSASLLKTISAIGIDFPNYSTKLVPSTSPTSILLVVPTQTSDNPRMFILCPNYLIIVFDAITFSLIGSIVLNNGPNCIVNGPLGNDIVFIGCLDGSILSVGVIDLQIKTQFSTNNSNINSNVKSAVNSMCAVNDNHIWCSLGQNGYIHCFDHLQNGTEIPIKSGPKEDINENKATILLPNVIRGRFVCSGNHKGEIQLWDTIAMQIHNKSKKKLLLSQSQNASVICMVANGKESTIWAATTDTHLHVIVGSTDLGLENAKSAKSIGQASTTNFYNWAFIASEARPSSSDQLLKSVSSFTLQFEDSNHSKAIARFSKEKNKNKSNTGGGLLSLKSFRFFCTMRMAELLSGIIYMQSLGNSIPSSRKVCFIVHGNTMIQMTSNLSVDISRIISGPEDIFVVSETATLSIAGTYADQLALLTINGCKTLADCVVSIIAQGFFSSSTSSIVPTSFTENVLDALASCTISHPIRIETNDKTLNWTDKGILQCSGILTPNKEMYVPQNYDPSCLFRMGSKSQAERLHMSLKSTSK